jgi:hypothetical protein
MFWSPSFSLSVQSIFSSYPSRSFSNSRELRSVAPTPTASSPSPPWLPIVLAAGGVSALTFGGFWLVNQKKTGVKPLNSMVDAAIEKADAFIESTADKLITTTKKQSKIQSKVQRKTVTKEYSKAQPQSVSLWQRMALGVVALYAASVALVSTIPTRVSTLGNKLYTLEFACKNTVAKGVELEVTKIPANSFAFKRSTQTIPKLLENNVDCPTILPALNAWGNNTPAPFITIEKEGNTSVGIVDFNTNQVIPLQPNNTIKPLREGASVDFIPIAPLYTSNPATLKRSIPLQVAGTIPSEYEKLLQEAFGYINELPEGRFLMEQVAKNNTKLVFVLKEDIPKELRSSWGWFTFLENTIYIPETTFLLLKTMLNDQSVSVNKPTIKLLIHVLIHEMGHALVDGYMNDIPDRTSNYSEELAVDLLARSLSRQLLGEESLFPLDASDLKGFTKNYQGKLDAFNQTGRQAYEILQASGFGDYSVVNQLTKQAAVAN